MATTKRLSKVLVALFGNVQNAGGLKKKKTKVIMNVGRETDVELVVKNWGKMVASTSAI